MHDYKPLHVMVMTCVTLVNAHAESCMQIAFDRLYY